jgi:hypothetical protein
VIDIEMSFHEWEPKSPKAGMSSSDGREGKRAGPHCWRAYKPFAAERKGPF